MSYVTEIMTARSIAQAADALDLIQSCQGHKLPKDSGKHKLLASVMKEATSRFVDLQQKNGLLSPDEFFRKSIERVNVMRAERASLMKIRREKRERDAAARAEFLDDLALIAA